MTPQQRLKKELSKHFDKLKDMAEFFNMTPSNFSKYVNNSHQKRILRTKDNLIKLAELGIDYEYYVNGINSKNFNSIIAQHIIQKYTSFDNFALRYDLNVNYIYNQINSKCLDIKFLRILKKSGFNLNKIG